MSAEEISIIAGVILTLVFSYIPGINSRFASLAPEYKRAIMLGLLVLVSGGILILACSGSGEMFGTAITCDRAGAIEMLKVLVAAIIANQGVYAISPRVGGKSGAK